MLVVAGSGDPDGARSGRPVELAEAVLLCVGRDEEVVHPLEAILQLLTRVLIQADRGSLGSMHVLHGILVDGREDAESAPDRAAPGSHVGDPAGLGSGRCEAVGGVALQLGGVEAVLLCVGRDEEVVHPLEAILQLLAHELIQADRGRLGSAHVLHGSLVDGREGAEGAPDRATPGSHVGDPAWLGGGRHEAGGGVALQLGGVEATLRGGERLGEVQQALAVLVEASPGLGDVGGVDVGADGDSEALHRGA